jgi:hypothetical protein
MILQPTTVPYRRSLHPSKFKGLFKAELIPNNALRA